MKAVADCITKNNEAGTKPSQKKKSLCYNVNNDKYNHRRDF